jgi:hypothetical protein
MGGKDENVHLGATGQISRSRRPRALATLFVLVLLGLLWFLYGQAPPEPAYGGKSLTAWLQTYDPSAPSGRGSPAWNETDEAVRQMGTNSIPILLQMLCEHDSKLKLRWVAWAQRQKFLKIHFVPAAIRNIEASRAFIVLGDAAKDAVPELMRVYQENNSAESRSAIEDAFSWIGPAAQPALPLLLQAATNSYIKMRANALWALGEIQAEPQLCVPELIRALGDSDQWARVSAAHALGRFGAEAEAAIPALAQLANIPDFLSVFVTTTGAFSGDQHEALIALQKIQSQVISPSVVNLPGFDIPKADPQLLPR